jgi:hypothetical protein
MTQGYALARLNSDGSGFTIFVDHVAGRFFDGKDMETPRVPHKHGYILTLTCAEAETFVKWLRRNSAPLSMLADRMNELWAAATNNSLWRDANEPVQ